MRVITWVMGGDADDEEYNEEEDAEKREVCNHDCTLFDRGARC